MADAGGAGGLLKSVRARGVLFLTLLFVFYDSVSELGWSG